VLRAPEHPPAATRLPEARMIAQPRRLEPVVYNAAMLREIRRFLDALGFLEVKTPMLQAAPEISFFHQAVTRPMHGASFHLRTDPEEYLKRYLTAGLDAVYEISTNVRDDTDDATHLTEFQSLEFYRRFMDFDAALALADQLIRHLVRRLSSAFGPQPTSINPDRPCARVRYADLTRRMTGIDIAAPDCATARGLAARIMATGLECRISGPAMAWRRNWLDALVDDHVLPSLAEPTWVTHFPADLAYSYRLDPTDPASTLRAELYLPGGVEVAHVYENLTVERDLRERYEDRRRHRLDCGLGEVEINEPLMDSARIGMPPMGGGAIGVERLLMALRGDDEIGAGVLFGREIAQARAWAADSGEDRSR
jgi:lysyl-tRNA synthetase class 2